MISTGVSVTLALGLAVLSAVPATAVNMNSYIADVGVEPEFKSFLTAFYTEAEAPASTTGFTAFFAEDATFNNEGVIGTGYAHILADKQLLCPTTAAPGSCLDHIVNGTSVFADTAASKTYLIKGAGKINVEGVCRLAWYTTQLTVNKDAAGTTNLAPASKSVQQTYVVGVQQVADPCTII